LRRRRKTPICLPSPQPRKALTAEGSCGKRTRSCICQYFKGTTMPNPEWGTKRICPTTGKRFYDLNKTPIISPYSGEIVDIETARRKAASVVIARPLPEKDEDVLVDDLEAEDDILEPGVADDADLDDDLLEDDADDTVSLDDLADVGGDEEEV